MEYSCELLNSNCDLTFIRNIVYIIMKNNSIEKSILNRIKSNYHSNNNYKQSKMVYDITQNDDILNYCIKTKLNKYYNYDLSWNFALEIIVNKLKKTFIDSTIYFENKEINDTNKSIQRLIIIDWNYNR